MLLPFFLVIYLQLPFINTLHLSHINNVDAFDRRAIGEELLLSLQLTQDELSYYTRPEHEYTQVCLMINGGICRCYYGNLNGGLGISLTEDCLPPSGWLFFLFNVVMTGPNNAHPASSNVIVFHRPSMAMIPSLPQSVLLPQTVDDTRKRVIASGFVPDKVTLLLLLTLDDLSRAAVLFHTLQEHFSDDHHHKKSRVSESPRGNERVIESENEDDNSPIHELLIFVPNRHYHLLSQAITGLSQSLPFPVRILAESLLFFGDVSEWKADPYAVQMSLKLLVAKVVRTPFYLTLDADILLLRRFSYRDIIRGTIRDGDRVPGNVLENDPVYARTVLGHQLSTNSTGYHQYLLPHQQAVYHHEDYSVHDFWWEGARTFLNAATDVGHLGFGVTPAMLSVWGSLTALGMVRATIGIDLPLYGMNFTHTPRECAYVRPLVWSEDESERGGEGEGVSEIEEIYCQRIGMDYFDRETVERVWLYSLGKYVWTEYTIYRIAMEVFNVRHSIISLLFVSMC